MNDYKFTGYYKYIFTFKNSNGDIVNLGGDADDIYRMDIDADTIYTIEELKNMGEIF